MAEPISGQGPAVFDAERPLIAIDQLRGFRHMAMHAYDRFEDDRAAVVVRKAEIVMAEVGPALARFRAAVDPD